MLRKFVEELGVAWATFFYVGRSPKAPGTMGSLAALPLAWYVWKLPYLYGWLVTAFIFVTGTMGAEIVGRRSGNSDDQTIVIDEVVGILITTSIAPQSAKGYALSFALFRLFDIWKPWPVRWVDRKWKTALGTMMDDAVAALMACIVLWVIFVILLNYLPAIHQFAAEGM